MKNSTLRHKNQANVSIKLAGEEPFDAIVFLAIGDRLLDLLNDSRNFIPVKRENGMIIVAKSQIESIIESELTEEDAQADAQNATTKPPRTFDPYTTLRVRPDATIAEIKSAYKARMKAVHPDAIAALGLDEDLAKAALQTTQKVNYAYRKIMSEREAESKNDQSRETENAN